MHLYPQSSQSYLIGIERGDLLEANKALVPLNRTLLELKEDYLQLPDLLVHLSIVPYWN